MSYSTQDWASKTVVTKTGLINMDNQISANEQSISAHADRITNIETGTTPAGKANQLKDSRTFVANLASTTPASFNGTGNVSMGVTGVLPVSNGGTGSNSIDSTPTKDSTKLVTSGGTYAAIAQAKSMDLELERFGYVCPEINGVKNYVDDDGIFHRKIARVDLTNFDWNAFPWWSSDHTFQTSLTTAKSTSAEVYLQGYDSDDTLDFSNAILSGTVNGVGIRVLDDITRIIISDSSCTTTEQIKSKLKGKYIYFELATEETFSAYDTPSLQDSIADEWMDDDTAYHAGEYRIYNNTLYKCLLDNRYKNPSRQPTYWQKCKLTDVVGMQNISQPSTYTSFVALANAVEKNVKHSFRVNTTNYTDKPSGASTWFAYVDIYCSSDTGFIALKYMCNQGEWSGFANATTVTWTKIA